MISPLAFSVMQTAVSMFWAAGQLDHYGLISRSAVWWAYIDISLENSFYTSHRTSGYRQKNNEHTVTMTMALINPTLIACTNNAIKSLKGHKGLIYSRALTINRAGLYKHLDWLVMQTRGYVRNNKQGNIYSLINQDITIFYCYHILKLNY